MASNARRIKNTAPLELSTISLQPEVDSFDEDFEYIIDRLLERMSANFGLLVRHCAEDGDATLLARTRRAARFNRESLERLARSVQQPAPVEAMSERGRIGQRAFEIECDRQRLPLRVLWISFSPAEGVVLAVLICRDNPRRRFGLVAQHAATRLYPVLARYLRLWWAHRAERRSVSALQAAVELSGSALMVLDRKARVVFCSSEARSLLNQDQGLRLRGRMLNVSNAEDGARLRAALQGAVEENSTNRPARDQRSVSILAINRASAKRDLVVAIASVEWPAVTSDDPAATVTVVDPEHGVDRLLPSLCAFYKLTPAESKLVSQLVRGLTLTEGAAKMAIQPETARAYLKQIFAKTATNRQTELVRLMLLSAVKSSRCFVVAGQSRFDSEFAARL